MFMKNSQKNRDMDDELRKIFLNAGIREAPEGFSGRLMNLIAAESEKPVKTDSPVISRGIWYSIALLATLSLLLAGFFGKNTSGSSGFITGFINNVLQKLPVVRIPLHDFPLWPVFLSFISLIVYLSEDYLIRQFIRRKH